MQPRYLQFGDYVTSVYGFTLCNWSLSPASYRAIRETIPGVDGVIDCSEWLTGHVIYDSRTLTAVLELSDGDRLYRKSVIDDMINRLDGQQMRIVLPDDPCRYLTGRVHVEQQYNDNAHAAVKVTAVCDPWKYDRDERIIRLTNDAQTQDAVIRNRGRKTVCPVFATDSSFTVLAESGDVHSADKAGAYQWDDVLFSPGRTELIFSGSGILEIRFREAIL